MVILASEPDDMLNNIICIANTILYFTKVTPEDLGEQPRTKFSNLDNDVIGDLISSAISNRKISSNEPVDCSIYDENEMVMHLAHPTDCNKFFKCQKGKAIGKRLS